MLKDIEQALTLILIENVVNKQYNISYKDAAEELGRRLGRTINPHYGLRNSLETIARTCVELGLPIITVRVVRSNGTNTKMAGEGFYRIACELKPEYKNWTEADAWRNENKLVRECKDWDKLKAYALGETIKTTLKTSVQRIDDPFADWLNKSTKLAESSVDKYARAVRTISQEMMEQKTIAKPIVEMDCFELDIAMALIAGNAYFAEKNKRGNHMYSNALKQFRYYRNTETVSENSSDSYVASIASDISIPETERTAIVQSRVGQGQFRKQLMDKYHGSCVITGINHPKLLVASHIKPWAASSNMERLQVDNGLLLSASYDRLFDSGLITFDKTGKIYLSSFIGVENEKKLHLQTGTQYPLLVTKQMQQFLEYHSDVVFVK
jgi:hypothetical protein